MELHLNEIDQLTILPSDKPLKVDVVTRGTDTQWPVIVINDNVVITAKLYLQVAGYVRGIMIREKMIPTSENPPMALMCKEKGWIEGCFEQPLQEFRYNTEQAKKLWRALRQLAEDSSR